MLKELEKFFGTAKKKSIVDLTFFYDGDVGKAKSVAKDWHDEKLVDFNNHSLVLNPSVTFPKPSNTRTRKAVAEEEKEEGGEE